MVASHPKHVDGRRVLVVDMTLTDPAFYTAPVTAQKRWAQVPNGRLLPYVVGAPDFVNAEFAAAFPSGLKGVLVILRTQTRQSIEERAAIQVSGTHAQDHTSRRRTARSGTW